MRCLLILAVLVAACGDDDEPVLHSLGLQIQGPAQVNPPAQSLFRALQTWSDGSIVDVTTKATWTSTNPSVLSIDNTGRATGLASGEAGLTVSLEGQTSLPRKVLVVSTIPEWNGTYTLTLGGGACTGSMPPELRQRTYTANLTQSGLTLTVEVPTAGAFSGRIINPQARFALLYGYLRSIRRKSLARADAPSLIQVGLDGRRAASEPRFHPSRYSRAAYPGYVASIVEVLPNGDRLSITGNAETTMSPSGFTGTLNGSVTLYNSAFNQLADCTSPSHVFTMTRN
jgi:hypothetical protein